MQCDRITDIRNVGALLTAGGGRCSRRAAYTDGERNFCAQHAKVAATVMTKARNQIRPECRPISRRPDALIASIEMAMMKIGWDR